MKRKAWGTFLVVVATMVAMLVCAAPALAADEPVTEAADSLRTGWYPDEAQLTPQLLENGGFGRVFDTSVQGEIYAQPLVSGDTLLAATEDNWIYGIDPQGGAIRWSRNVGTPWNSEDIGCTDLKPHVGITGTPVIDPAANVAYFFSKTYAFGDSGPAVWNMYAINLANGENEPGFPVQISGSAQNLPGVNFEPTHQLQRPALLLMNGVVYAAFGSLCDTQPYQGWIVGVSIAGPSTGQIKAMWATAEEGAAIWQAGGGLVSDGEGRIFFASGNGPSPPAGPGSSPPEGSLGESVARVDVQHDGTLKAEDFFSPFDNTELSENDLDLGSGAPLGLPSQFGTEAIPNLMVEVGKPGVIYLLNRKNLGGMGQGSEGKDGVVQEIPETGSLWGSMAAWPGDGGYVYIPSTGPGGVDASEGLTTGSLEVLQHGVAGSGAPRLSLVATSPETEPFGYGSGSPLVTSNGTTAGSGIVWTTRCSQPLGCESSTLNAYAAVPKGGVLEPLWSGGIGVSTKFARPDATGGHIYVGTYDGHLLGFGPLPVLSVAREGTGSGSVSSQPAGINCGSICRAPFPPGAPVTLTAAPSAHSEFIGWSGCASTAGDTCRVESSEDRQVTATFTLEKTLEPPSVPLPNSKIAAVTVRKGKRTVTFRFRGEFSPLRFQCKLIKPGRKRSTTNFSLCTSPKTYTRLKPGRYTFEVRAINAAGPDPSPAVRRFRI